MTLFKTRFQVSSLKFQVFLGLIACVFMIASCKKEEDHPAPPVGGYQYTSGDTLITIPGTAVNFAQHNFSRDAQLLREYQIATNSQYVNPVWALPLNSWKQTSFDQRQSYMIPPFNYDVTTTDSALFYYEIGTYFDQFGFGWRDTFDTTTFDPNIAYTEHLWPTDPIQTVGFDGESNFIGQYRAMWR